MLKLIMSIVVLSSTSLLACGSWKLEDLEEKVQVQFFAESISISVRVEKLHLSRKIRSDGERVFFYNGDQARIRKGVITYWSRDRIDQRKWTKKVIGSIDKSMINIEKLKPLKSPFEMIEETAEESKYRKVTLYDSERNEVMSGRIMSFCNGSEVKENIFEKEKNRIIAYLIWKSQKPDLTVKAENWWW